MDPQLSALLELIMFFVFFPLAFQAFVAFDLSKFFKKNYNWQIQFIYIISAIIFAYLASNSLLRLFDLMYIIFD